jgi:signal transduction histidine kinase/YHS domain-containing protein
MHPQRKRLPWRSRDAYAVPLRELQSRAEAMARGDFSTVGSPLDGPSAVDDLRRAVDVLGEHVEQALRGIHASFAALTTAQETERGRLARELHDDTVQQLVVLGQGVDRVQREWERNPDRAREHLAQLRSDIVATIQSVRTLIGDLRPPALEELGLLPAVRLLFERSDAGTPDVTIEVDGTERRLDAPAELALFRIVQEAWNNIQRHAHAQRATFVFRYSRNALVVTVEDDGQGFEPPATGQARSGSWGLLGMHERAALVGGTVEVASQPGQGTRLVIRVPYLGNEGRDPVCGMEVGPEGLSAEYTDRLYRFCSQACHDLFVAHPEQYVEHHAQ